MEFPNSQSIWPYAGSVSLTTALFAVCASLTLTPARAEDPSLQSVEKSAGRWLDLRNETAQLETQWANQRPLMESLIRSLRDRSQDLETKRTTLEAKTAKDREELSALEAANKSGQTEVQAAEARLAAVSEQLLKLRANLPPRLSAALEMSYRSLSAGQLSINERMQIVMTVLGRCLQFNRSINYGQESLRVPGQDGEKLLEVIYWGLGQGYALDRATNRAWLGRPADGGWTWEAKPEAAPAVAALIATYQDKADPGFVALPARLDETAAAHTP